MGFGMRIGTREGHLSLGRGEQASLVPEECWPLSNPQDLNLTQLLACLLATLPRTGSPAEGVTVTVFGSLSLR